VCLPMAPVLPLKGSGDFGTSPVFGQLLGEPQPACSSQLVLPHLEHNSRFKELRVNVTVGFDSRIESDRGGFRGLSWRRGRKDPC
jgi:hypothetical protein